MLKQTILFGAIVAYAAAFAVPVVQERSLLDTLLHSLHINQTLLRNDMQIMLDLLGSDPSEQACEQEIEKLLHSSTVLVHGAGLICHSFQELVHHFKLTPDTTKPMVGRRDLLDQLEKIFHINATLLRKDLQIMLDTLGSDPNEHKCEEEVQKLLHNNILFHGAPLLCHSFQELVHHFQLTPNTPAVGRRDILSTLEKLFHINVTTLKQDVQVIVQTLGSDPSEYACEQEVEKLFAGNLLFHSAPILCHSLQSLIQHFGFGSQPVVPVGKRFFLDDVLSFVNSTSLAKDLQVLVDNLGSDPNEQACEDEIHKLFAGSTLFHAAPLVCRSFQSLVHQFHLTPDTNVTTATF